MNNYLFEIVTPLNFIVHITNDYWEKLLFKHPELDGKLDDVKKTLGHPIEIRKSKRDELVFLFYSEESRYWLCVVTKQTGKEGFVITAYVTDKIKEGEIVWQK